MEKYMQMTPLKIKFITWITSYRENQTWNGPAGLHLFKKETPTQVFSGGTCELSRTVVVVSENT